MKYTCKDDGPGATANLWKEKVLLARLLSLSTVGGLQEDTGLREDVEILINLDRFLYPPYLFSCS